MRAQGTIEYLVIIAVVVVISLILVGVLTNLFSPTQVVEKTQNINSQSRLFSVTDVAFGIGEDANGIIGFKNNTTGTITNLQIIIDEKDHNYFNENIVHGSSKYFLLENLAQPCGQNDTKIKKNLTVKYVNQYGLEKTEFFEITIDCLSNPSSPHTLTLEQQENETQQQTNSFTLEVVIVGSGSVEVDGVEYSGVLTFDEDSIVDINAISGEGYSFIEWSGSAQISETGSAETTITMIENSTITATFEEEIGIDYSCYEYEVNNSVNNFYSGTYEYALDETYGNVWKYPNSSYEYAWIRFQDGRWVIYLGPNYSTIANECAACTDSETPPEDGAVWTRVNAPDQPENFSVTQTDIC